MSNTTFNSEACAARNGGVSVLGVEFDLLDYRQAFEKMLGWRQQGQRETITITNPHSVLLCGRNESMRRATAAALTLPDGVGVIWAARILGYAHHGRVTGPTLMLKACDWGREHGLRHYFLGGADGVAEKLADVLSEKYPGLEVAGVCCPPFRPLSDAEDAELIAEVNATRPDIVWVGLGAPKQEKWMHAHLGQVDAAAMVGVGAAFDFHSGNVKWAPRWLRYLGMEWAYRLVLEPKRMWRRNLDSPLFLAKVVGQRIARTLRFGSSRSV